MFLSSKKSGLFEYHEILGSELPIYAFQPNTLYRLNELPNGSTLHATNTAYLKRSIESQDYYEPLYSLTKGEE